MITFIAAFVQQHYYVERLKRMSISFPRHKYETQNIRTHQKQSLNKCIVYLLF